MPKHVQTKCKDKARVEFPPCLVRFELNSMFTQRQNNQYNKTYVTHFITTENFNRNCLRDILLHADCVKISIGFKLVSLRVSAVTGG